MMKPVLLAGCGPMAVEYAKVLKAQGIPFLAVGRGEEGTARFEKETGASAIPGGIEAWKRDPQITRAIIAVGERRLGEAAIAALRAGISELLIEKPGGYDPAEISAVASLATEMGAKAYVGYNRRFYASVRTARELIAEDAGAKSFCFEFTEWSHRIKDIPKEAGTKAQWFLHNSSHVADMAFHLGGKPSDFSSYVRGGLDWHPSGSVFCGAGVAEGGALFNYQANWEAPGRWGVEILTSKRRFIFRPLEKLQVQMLGSVAIEPYPLDDRLDTEYKPGLYLQVQAFLAGGDGLCSLEEQVRNLAYLRKIGGI